MRNRMLVMGFVASVAMAGIPSAALAQVYYENCDAVRAAGAAPLLRGEPGYRPGLDRDDDGVACEVGGGGGQDTTTTSAPAPVPETTATTTPSTRAATPTTKAPPKPVAATPSYTG